MVFLFLQIRCKFSDRVQFTVSTSVRRETGSAGQNNSVKSGTKILPSCEQTRTHCRCLNVWKCRVTSTIGEQKSFPTLCPQLQDFSSFTDLIYFKTEKASLSSPHLPQTMLCHATCSNKRVNIGRGGGGAGGMVQIVCISELAIWRQCVRWTTFWPICRLYFSCPE